MISITPMIAMKKYVGMENTSPDSRTPLRFPNAMTAMNPSEISTAYGAAPGIADANAAVPAATDTETVRM